MCPAAFGRNASCDTVGADAHIGPDVRAIHSALRMIGRGGENGTGFPYAGICVVKINKFHEKKLSGIENLIKAIDTVGKSCYHNTINSRKRYRKGSRRSLSERGVRSTT